jgi:hypothetical protein
MKTSGPGLYSLIADFLLLLLIWSAYSSLICSDFLNFFKIQSWHDIYFCLSNSSSAGVVAQVVEHLPNKHKALSLKKK